MMREQIVIAFIAKLHEHGVDATTISEAVDDVLDIKLGESITGDDELVRSFCMEQARRLERVVNG